MTFRFHLGARIEYRASTEYYESQLEGLGARFTMAVEDAIRRILDDPNRWPLRIADTRRYLLQGFPYQIVYTVEGDTLVIHAVMHCARLPGDWHSRLE